MATFRDKLLQPLLQGEIPYDPTAGNAWGNPYWNPGAEDISQEAVKNKVYNKLIEPMPWTYLLMQAFQGGTNLTPTILEDVTKRVNATGWDDAKKKEAVLKGINDHYAKFGSGFTEWSTPEGIAGLFGLPDYNTTQHQAEGQKYSAQHAIQAKDDDLESLQNALIMAAGAAAVGGGFAGLYGAAGGAGAGAASGAAGAGAAGAGAAIPELGLIATPATANAAIAAGIPSGMLSGGAGALGLGSAAADMPWGVNAAKDAGGSMYGDAIEGLIDLTNQGLTGEQAIAALGEINPAWTQTGLEFLLNNPSQIFSSGGNLLKSLTGGNSGSSSGSSNDLSRILGQLFGNSGLGDLVGSGVSLAARTAPGLMALEYAKSQPGLNVDSLNQVLASSQNFDPLDWTGGILERMQAQNPGAAIDPILSKMQAQNPGAAIDPILNAMKSQNPGAAFKPLLDRMQAYNPSAAIDPILSRMQAQNPGAAFKPLLDRMQAYNPGAAFQPILSQLAGNQNAIVRAATDPVQQNISAGYGDLLKSQGLRGIRGSSFGTTDIANFLDTGNRTLGNVAAEALQGSLGLQGQLVGQQGALQNQLFGLQGQTLGQQSELQNQLLSMQGQLAGTKGQLQNQLFGLQGQTLGQQSELQNQLLSMQGQLAGTKGQLQNQLLGMQGDLAGTKGQLENQILGMAGSLASNAASQSSQNFATQGTLAAQIAALVNQSQQNKNNLYGKAFDILGRSVSPGGFGSSLTLAS